ncbi:hypothetical protein RV134_350712 [Roseovarius sp. EC-HK134]|nr:hypothetical protein RV134_350712 [Roseovarius sp. EC-HK134]VVT32207.1 hypothetical protein RV420_440019 [Roseovarius sp. EC-SD190]
MIEDGQFVLIGFKGTPPDDEQFYIGTLESRISAPNWRSPTETPIPPRTRKPLSPFRNLYGEPNSRTQALREL